MTGKINLNNMYLPLAMAGLSSGALRCGSAKFSSANSASIFK